MRFQSNPKLLALACLIIGFVSGVIWENTRVFKHATQTTPKDNVMEQIPETQQLPPLAPITKGPETETENSIINPQGKMGQEPKRTAQDRKNCSFYDPQTKTLDKTPLDFEFEPTRERLMPVVICGKEIYLTELESIPEGGFPVEELHKKK